MADSDNDSENHHKQWSQDDWRLLVITFAGSLGAIVVGAALLALVVALARIAGPGKNLALWILLVVFTTAGAGFCILVLRAGVNTRSDRFWVWNGAFWGILGILIMRGVAAGIK